MVTPAAPAPRRDFHLVFDAQRGRVLGHGGAPDDGGYNDTWEYDGTTWTQVALSDLPAVRAHVAMAYDPLVGATVLDGGRNPWPDGDLTDTWHLVDGTWALQAASGTPSASYSFQLAFDDEGSRLVGFSGIPQGQAFPTIDVHEYAGVSPQWFSTVGCCPDGRHDAGWTHARPFGGTLMFGGRACCFFGSYYLADDTWVLNGLQWTEHLPPTHPSARFEHGLAFDAARGIAVLHGGNGSLSGISRLEDTWIYNGQDWQLLMASSPPGSRLGLSLVYDAARERVVLYGDGPALEGVTWEFNGTTWTARPTPFQPDPDRCWNPMAYDSAREVVLLFGGRKCSATVHMNDTWAYGPDPDGDGIVGGLDNCRDTPNANQTDGDSDGAGDVCDCAPGDGGSFAPPQEVTGLTAEGATGISLSWEDQAPLAGSAVVYDLVTGLLLDLRSSGDFSAASCLAPGLTSPGSTDGRMPPTEDGYYYLARARNACGTSTYGPGRKELDTASPCP